MPVSTIKTRLGNDVSLWCQMLSEAKAARAVVENSSREKAFGPVIVDYSSVQAKVGAWGRDVQVVVVAGFASLATCWGLCVVVHGL